MNWNFFSDGTDEGKPYESFDDWYQEIKHLIIPTIVMVILGVAIYIYFRFFHF
ncbi:hypothetical protein [Roseivirga pacifica]|uniref:hypothetical protein n=1 Tax=Roseivirga pacifica TaxID=1267423 RepID=UPI003BB1B1B1